MTPEIFCNRECLGDKSCDVHENVLGCWLYIFERKILREKIAAKQGQRTVVY